MNQCTGLGWMLQSAVLRKIIWYAQKLPLVNHGNLSSWHDLLIGHSSRLLWISSIGDHTYLVCTDRLTDWLILYYLEPGHTTTTKLMSICQQLFQTYGAQRNPVPMVAHLSPPTYSKNSLGHSVLSTDYPPSHIPNGREKLTVKTAKRIVNENIGPQGSLNNDNVAQAILQYWNTSI